MTYRITTVYTGTPFEYIADSRSDVVSYILSFQHIWAAVRSSFLIQVYDEYDSLIFKQLVGEINDMAPNYALDLSVFD